MGLGERWRLFRSRINRGLVKRSIVKMVTFKSVEFVGTTLVAFLFTGSLFDSLVISLVTDFAIPGAWFVVHELLWEAKPAEKHAELVGAVGIHR